ncbi:MAG: FtsX-like permease family protein [Longimicrobiales bacterium]|jgi:putative ABC transport system permease protein
MMLHVKGEGGREPDAAAPPDRRCVGALIAAFSGLALLLAAVGLNGLVSYGASQRVREMGIRIALGARPESLIRLARTLQGLLFPVEPSDPLVIGASAAVRFATVTLAAWLPARRASRVDAAISLRDQAKSERGRRAKKRRPPPDRSRSRH